MLAARSALVALDTNNMIYHIGDLLAHYSIATGRLLDTCIIVDIRAVYNNSAYAYTAYSSQPPDLH